eukprot:UN29507
MMQDVHHKIQRLHAGNADGFKDFVQCETMGCTSTNPEEICNFIRQTKEWTFKGREEIMCQPRFGVLIKKLLKQKVIQSNHSFNYQVEAVNPKYEHKYPFANVSMVFEKGDKSEKIQEVAVRGL